LPAKKNKKLRQSQRSAVLLSAVMQQYYFSQILESSGNQKAQVVMEVITT
jgi:hypothetical protein